MKSETIFLCSLLDSDRCLDKYLFYSFVREFSFLPAWTCGVLVA